MPHLQAHSPRLPKRVPIADVSGQTRLRVLEPWRNFPREYAYLLALGRDPSLARKRRRGERPVTIAVLVEWLKVCKRLAVVAIGRQSLQELADIIDHDVVPRTTDRQLKSVPREIADASRSLGAAMAAFLEAMEDGEITPDEAAELLPLFESHRDEVDEAIEALRRLVEEKSE